MGLNQILNLTSWVTLNMRLNIKASGSFSVKCDNDNI